MPFDTYAVLRALMRAEARPARRRTAPEQERDARAEDLPRATPPERRAAN